MIYMLCRNRVTNFEQWNQVFEAHTEAHREAGLHLIHLWREHEDPSQVYFLFEIESIARAQAFLASPQAPEDRARAGVLEGVEVHYLDDQHASTGILR